MQREYITPLLVRNRFDRNFEHYRDLGKILEVCFKYCRLKIMRFEEVVKKSKNSIFMLHVLLLVKYIANIDIRQKSLYGKQQDFIKFKS